ncbi:uncharacterized protein LOC127811771 [Diospyros lotus]|uniref:uncharacterized protein LOC127811771 n=1 Tax=Diospyros lotus TaxID=55363 RepID=UPI00225252E0|nr:uncharacterized protein LOC127811771 [Diospyros lotus]
MAISPPICLPLSSSSVAAVDEFLQRQQEVLQILWRELASAQHRMKQFADCRRSEWEFSVGDLVYLPLRHAHQRALTNSPISKFSPKLFGPFQIVAKFGPIAYQLPPCSHIHPVFHVSLLKKSVGTQQVSSILPNFGSESLPRPEPVLRLDKRVIY